MHITALGGVAWFMCVLTLATIPTASSMAREYGPVAALRGVTRGDGLEDLVDTDEIDPDDAASLAYLLAHPIDINTADVGLLAELPGVDRLLARDMVAARPFADNQALARVLSAATLERLQPFITVGRRDVDGPAPWTGTAAVGALAGRRGVQSFARMAAQTAHGLQLVALATLQPVTQTRFDNSRQLLVGHTLLQPRLAQLAVQRQGATWSWVVGTFYANFATGLTFASGGGLVRPGWSTHAAPALDVATARLRVRPSLLGGAITWHAPPLGHAWLDVTGFFSSQPTALYQYDLCYHAASHTAGACHRQKDCPSGYRCGVDGGCHAHTVMSDETDESLRGVTLAEGKRESLVGAHLALHVDERTQLAMTAYTAAVRLQVAGEATPTFSASAGHPLRPYFGAVGVYGTWGIGPIDIAAEYSRTDLGAHAALLRLFFSLGRIGELTASLRHYGENYDNPFNHALAAADTVFGMRARNEQGLRLHAALWPVAWLQWRTDIDTWRPLAHLVWDAANKPAWHGAMPQPGAWHVHLRHQLDLALTTHEWVDIGVTHSRAPFAPSWLQQGRVFAGMSSHRGVQVAWRGSVSLPDEADALSDRRLALRAAWPLWADTWARLQVRVNTVGNATNWSGFVDWQQTWSATWRTRARYGVLWAAATPRRPASLQHVARWVVEAEL